MAARVILPDLAVPDNAFAEVTKATLPVGLVGLVLAAALAAVMSTASACILAASTILANDVYAGYFRRSGDRVRLSRIFTLLVGAAVLTISLIVKDVVGALTVAYDLLSGALFVPIIGALFWRRATGAGALAAMTAGAVAVVTLMFFYGLLANAPIIGGMLTSAVVFVVVSLLTRPTGTEEGARGAA